MILRLLVPLLLISQTLAQIGSIQPNLITVVEEYDSSKNYLGNDPIKYLNQEIYLPGLRKEERGHGFQNFFNSPIRPVYINENIYKCCTNLNSNYDSLKGSTYRVVDVRKYKNQTWYLKLINKGDSSIAYYRYLLDSDEEFEKAMTIFPFIVMGYFEKIKSTYLKKSFIIKTSAAMKSSLHTNIETGQPIDSSWARIWVCKDVLVEEENFHLALLLESDRGERILLRPELAGREEILIPVSKASILRRQWGKKVWEAVVQNKVSIGMDSLMVRLAWGAPSVINQTIHAGSKSDQWIFHKTYIYITNGKVTGMQQSIE